MVVSRGVTDWPGRSISSGASFRASATSAVSPLRSCTRGATVLAVSDVSGGLYAIDGLDVPLLTEYVRQHGSLEDCDAGVRLTNEELLELECDARPCRARGSDQLRERAPHSGSDDRRGRERPDVARGRRDLAERGILVLPDILTNAGGVTVSYFEWRIWAVLLDARRDPRQALSEALRRLRPCLGSVRGAKSPARQARLVSGVREALERTRSEGIFP